MFKLAILFVVISIALTVWCLVEVISADRSRVRSLRKLWWILLILVVPFAGPIAWLLAGRPSIAAERAAAARAFAEFERPGRLDPDDPAKDAAYRDLLRERAEEQRRRYEQQQKHPEEPEAEQPEAEQPEAE